MILLQDMTVNEVAKEYLDAYNGLVSNQSKFWIWLLLGIGLQIISSVISLITQLRLKNLDKNIVKFNLREERRVKVQEEIFRQMVEFTWFIPGDSIDSLRSQIYNLDNYSQVQRLYISDSSRTIINNYLDHFRAVLASPYRKNIEHEQKMLDAYYTIFNA